MNRLHLVVAFAVLTPILCLFGPLLIGGKTFLFRDAAHYYYPLFAWCCGEWAAGRVPLWNPYENCGLPILADSSSSVLYPGKIVFAIPAIDFATQYTLYIVGHVLLAIAAAFLLARQLRCSILAASLCGLSYGLSGSVLFQYCNAVFLVGAAWLPLALLAGYRMIEDRSVAWSLGLAALLAVMTLGGDAQAAYHAGLLTALLAFISWRKDRARWSEQPHDNSTLATPTGLWSRVRSDRLFLLSFAGLVAALLALVQILPTIEWTRRSDRTLADAPRTIYEIPGYLSKERYKEPRNGWRPVLEGLFSEPKSGTHQRHIYDFSLAPWHLPEFWWPNISGRLFPTHRRWTAIIPAEGRTWTPSLYMGVLPFVLACCAFRLRGGDVRNRWISWTVVLAATGALGWYGFGWLLHEIRCGLLGHNPDDSMLGMPVGGLYWLMVTGLPGYAYFRFPAKLTVVMTLGLSVLAARGWDDWPIKRSSWPAVGFGFLAAISGGLLVGLQFSGVTWLSQFFAGVPPDDVFGPFDLQGALADIGGALLQTAVLSGVFFLLCLFPRRWPTDGTSWIPIVALMVTSVDLYLAQRALLTATPASLLRNPSQLQTKLEQIEQDDSSEAFRIYRGSLERWTPKSWKQESSASRQEQVVRWDRETAFPKYPLLARYPLVESYGTMASRDFLTFMQAAKRLGPQRSDGVHEPHQRVLNLLAARYLVLPDGVSYPGMTSFRPSGQRVENAAYWRNSSSFPRAWIVHRFKVLPPLESPDLQALHARAREVLMDGDALRDFRHTAVVETDQAMEKSTRPVKATASGETCRIVADGPQRVVIEAELRRDGLVVLSDLIFPGWIAEVTSDSSDCVRRVPVLRCNRIMRGVHLSAGHHRIEFVYRPRSFYVGALLSALAWLGLISYGICILPANRL